MPTQSSENTWALNQEEKFCWAEFLTPEQRLELLAETLSTIAWRITQSHHDTSI
jgi:hypothetical protein